MRKQFLNILKLCVLKKDSFLENTVVGSFHPLIAFVKSMICYLPFRPRLLFKGRQFGYSPSKAQSKTRTETASRLHALPLLVKKARDVLDTGYPRYTWLWSNYFFGYGSSFTDKCRGWELLIIASGALGRWWHVWMLEKKKWNAFIAKVQKIFKENSLDSIPSPSVKI